MPLKLDPRTLDRSIGLYARVLVDVDFAQPLLSKLRVTRANGSHVIVEIDYEPSVCGKCGIIGHMESNCRVSFAPVDSVPRGRSTFRSRPKR